MFNALDRCGLFIINSTNSGDETTITENPSANRKAIEAEKSSCKEIVKNSEQQSCMLCLIRSPYLVNLHFLKFNLLFQTIKCNLCDIKNKVILWKKTQTRDLSKLNEMNESNNMVLTEVKPVESEPPRTKKAKKKRNKDINAGLLYSLQKDTNSVKTLVNINQKLQTLNIEKTKSTPIQPKITLQQSKKNSPKPPKQSILNPKKSSCKIVKNISQPMGKRSNLLQLANALKSKGYQSNSKSSADKLKQLLK